MGAWAEQAASLWREAVGSHTLSLDDENDGLLELERSTMTADAAFAAAMHLGE